jgi:hypothetical protein
MTKEEKRLDEAIVRVLHDGFWGINIQAHIDSLGNALQVWRERIVSPSIIEVNLPGQRIA